MKILAIDLGKFNSVACIYDEKITKNRFQKFITAPAVLHDLFVVVYWFSVNWTKPFYS